jgi:hypothetical protein
MIDYLTPACFGVMCPRHKDCQRYAAVENAPHTQQRIGTCDPSLTTFPLFAQKGPTT